MKKIEIHIKAPHAGGITGKELVEVLQMYGANWQVSHIERKRGGARAGAGRKPKLPITTTQQDITG